ncbi:hypothetical protein AVEN_52854-1 [Araneus ventricosus]|uniref:DUF7041 domain-containing protein n=1 Tax=Araneus ventricosus TaxID=182803 RepID=A0A4Y2I574_ARAVE|nr:hypothetical protein AVEN_52854-1 [Araneus ventricosus]
MSDINAVQIPVFNRSDPGLGFVMCESTFALATPKAITESVTKYNYIVSHLPPDSASLIRDVLMKPDATDPYSQIKKELINRSGESFQHEIRKLLSGEELGNRKPSELLRNMKRRAESLNVADNLMLELFLQRLPSSVQTILAAVSELTLRCVYTCEQTPNRIVCEQMLASVDGLFYFPRTVRVLLAASQKLSAHRRIQRDSLF